MNCENEFLVDDPYSELSNVDPSDILVFVVDCEEQITKAGSQIEVTEPEPEEIDYTPQTHARYGKPLPFTSLGTMIP